MKGINSSSSPTTPLQLDRRLFHLVAGAIIPLTGFLWGWPQALILAAVSSVLLVAIEFTRLRSATVNRWFVEWLGILLKPNEERRVTAATYLAVAALATLLLYNSTVAGLALLYLAFGDPAAALVGSRFGRVRWFHVAGEGFRGRPGKTLEGTLAFLVVALGVAFLLWYKGAFTAYWPAAVGAAVAAIIELLPLPLDDNLSIPLVSGAIMTALWIA